MNSQVWEQLSPAYSRYTFRDIFPDEATFKTGVKTNNLLESEITDAFLSKFYYMLFAKYANSPISKSDSEEWLYDLIFTMNAFIPTYLKKESIQKQLRALDLADVRVGFQSIFNHAFNPSTTPSTGTDEELPYVNEQNVNKTKKNPVDALSSLWEMLHTNLWEELLRKFQKLFSKIVTPANNVFYVTED